jgi:putative oxidoreductase
MVSAGLRNAAALAGRLLLAAIFIQEGWAKIGGYENTIAYMGKSGVPGSLLPVVIAVELLGGLLIVIGWQTRLVAVGLAIFTLLAAYFFHMNFGDRSRSIL